MSPAVFARIIALLDSHNATYRVVKHEPAGKSADVSVVRGSPLHEGGKALVVQGQSITDASTQYFLLIMPSDKKANFAALDGYENVKLCAPEKVEELTGCVIGTVPPFSFNDDLKLIVDTGTTKNEHIWFNAGLLDTSIELSTPDYVKVVQPEVRDITA